MAAATYQEVLAEIFGKDLKHFYLFDALDPLKDLVGSVDAVAKGTGNTWSAAGYKSNGSGYLEIPDHRDFSVSTTGALGIIYEMTVHDWTKVSANNEYIHCLGKGELGGTNGNHEWTFRYYKKGGINEAVTRKDRTSFYVFNPKGDLGAGSYVQEDKFRTDKRLIVGGSNIAQNKVMIRVDGNGDADPLSGYNIRPMDKAAPVRVGTRDTKTGMAVATFHRLAFVSRMPTVAEVEKIRAAQKLPDRVAVTPEPPEPPRPSEPVQPLPPETLPDTLFASGLDDVVAKHNALVAEFRIEQGR